MNLRSFALFASLIATPAMAFPQSAPFRILIYHAHENLSYNEAVFREQMDFLAGNGYTTVTPDQFLDWRLDGTPMPPRPILLTIDDNYIKVYTSVWPILHERGQVIVNFTITDLVAYNQGLQYCDYDQIREMEASGAVLSESHSRTHPHLSQLPMELLEGELAGSRQDLEDAIPGKTCLYIAYPYGDYDVAVQHECRMAGYRAGFAVGGGLNYRDTDVFALQRIGADGITLDEFKSVIGFNELPPVPPRDGWIVDDTDVNFFIDQDGWTTEAGGTPFHLGAHVRDGDDGAAQARWGLQLPEGGACRVWAWWTAAPGRTTDALYTVSHRTGETTIEVDQTAGGGTWFRLGTYSFAEGDPAEVVLTTSGGGTVSADAIWFEKLPPPTGNAFAIY